LDFELMSDALESSESNICYASFSDYLYFIIVLWLHMPLQCHCTNNRQHGHRHACMPEVHNFGVE
jgi:hypothetical protein